MKGTLIQVTNAFEEHVGLLYTEKGLSSQELNELELYLETLEWDDLEDFADKVNDKGFDLERVFAEEIQF